MKLAIILTAVIVLASCELIPAIEGENFPLGMPRTPPQRVVPAETAAPEPPQAVESKSEERTQEEPLLNIPAAEDEEPTSTETAVSEETGVSGETPAEIAVSEETDVSQETESLAQQPSQAPFQPPPQPVPPAPVRPPQTVQPPPPAPTQPPQTVQPPQAAQQPRRETPPPTPPVTVQPAQPAPPPPPARENPAVAIPDMPFQPATAVPSPAENNLPFSRTVRALVGQYIEIPFRGPGWVYLGEFGSRRGVSYDSRRMEEDGMTFIFRAEAEGTFSLRFNRQDLIRDNTLNDYVRVIVEQRQQPSGSNWSTPQTVPPRVYATPRWPLPTDPEGRTQAPSTSGERTTSPLQAADMSTAAETPVPAASTEIVEDWLKIARDEYNASRIPGALNALDQFMIRNPEGNDEAYWLYGQSLEANNEATRDIRLALDYYRRLIREFPLSSRCNDAQRRIAYLERFYFSIQ